MSQDFTDFQDDDFESDAPVFSDSTDMDDDLDFDNLRRQSARSGSTFDDMEMDADSELNDDLMLDDDDGRSRSRFSFRNFTPMQRLILAILLFLDIGAISFGVLVLMGIVS